MKKCNRCQAEIENEALFCPECGAQQEREEVQAVTVSPQPEADTVQLLCKLSNVVKWEKIGYIGMGMVAISVVLPLVSISLLSMTTSMINISQLLSFAVLAFCCFAAYYFSEEKYNIALSIGLGFLLTFGIAYYKLYSAMANLGSTLKNLTSSNVLGSEAALVLPLVQGFADKLIGMGIGVYFLLAGALVLIVASAACRLARKKAVIDIGSVFAESKLALRETAEIGAQRLPAYLVTVLVAVILIFIAMNIEIFTMKISAIL